MKYATLVHVHAHDKHLVTLVMKEGELAIAIDVDGPVQFVNAVSRFGIVFFNKDRCEVIL